MYYEIYGTGAQTLTLIRGLGADLSTWFPQIPELSKHFRTLVFDNRGAGRTDKPDAPYSIKQMADDTNGLLEALNIRRTALLGISMGGMIAEEFAFHFPEQIEFPDSRMHDVWRIRVRSIQTREPRSNIGRSRCR